MTSSVDVSENADRPPVRFEPLRPASRGRLILGLVLGPLLWLIALVISALVFHYSWAIQLGLVVTAACFVVALLGLALLHAGRRRQERRYVARG